MTLVVYSGVPDPVWSVHSRHGKFREMKHLLDEATVTKSPYYSWIQGFLVHEPGAEHAE